MTATTILAQLQASGVSLGVVAPDRLRVEAPRGVVTAEVQATLAKHKAEIIAELRRRDVEPRSSRFFLDWASDSEAWRAFDMESAERASIMEIDGGLSRDEALLQAEIITFEDWLN
jgi:hypothetical protein